MGGDEETKKEKSRVGKKAEGGGVNREEKRSIKRNNRVTKCVFL